MQKLLTTKDLYKEIELLLIDSPKVTILTAYLSKDAVNKVFQNSTREVELFTSFYREFVDAAGLEALYEMNAKVFIHTGTQFFHPKVYIFHSTKPVAILGSSNFTLGGLQNNLELNIATDDTELLKNLIDYIEHLKRDPLVGQLTKEALAKYKSIEGEKSRILGKTPPYKPNVQDYSELQRHLSFPPSPVTSVKPSSDRVLKFRLSSKGQHSRDMWSVVWVTERRNIVYGRSTNFFPSADQEFQVQFVFAGHEFKPIRTHITSSKQISGLPMKLRRAGFKLKPGDILCFEEVEPKKLYRFWLEKDETVPNV
ncbi:MAG: phospholipase D-like domain-containing protein [Bacteroidota bacterium]|nr:phospholipase D-like domain-containing protein [Bacteroidota bacterium]